MKKPDIIARKLEWDKSEGSNKSTSCIKLFFKSCFVAQLTEIYSMNTTACYGLRPNMARIIKTSCISAYLLPHNGLAGFNTCSAIDLLLIHSLNRYILEEGTCKLDLTAKHDLKTFLTGTPLPFF